MQSQVGTRINVNDTFQSDYTYELSAPTGEDFDDAFRPKYIPSEMLKLGVFEGKYLNDCQNEFPKEWFHDSKLSKTANAELNCFGIKSRQPLSVWQDKGWAFEPDPRGWFQWYCRYYLGRRLVKIDAHQIKRWKGFARHAGQVRKNCAPADVFSRPRQRQALLQWAYDPFI
jgi:hypothetical protein